MTLAPGTDLGPYRIEAPIGAGGMGAVWKARDTRLDRTVAVKTIEGRFNERFEREAKTIASLNHPHICTLFDVGENYLVMEYIEGAPLKGPLPVSEVVRLGAQIADALDAAHRKGITHRDLKPANVLVTKAGAKVIDFGLAKSGPIVRGETDVTLTRPLTSEGTILGTVPYMSPEQLHGQEADARSDIFALGCVLYEMLTGKRAFDGKSPVSIMAAILEHEPAPLSETVVPQWLDRIIRRCLRKNPDDRWQSAHDVGIQLLDPHQPDAAAALHRGGNRLVAALSVAAILASLLAGWALMTRPAAPKPAPTYTFNIPGPAGQTIYAGGSSISPNGRWITYLSMHDGQPHLWLHSVETGEVRPLAGTGSASYPFWSPDSGSIGFFANGKLRRYDLVGGTARVLCDAPRGFGGSWGEDHHIVFAPGFSSPLHRVADAGGAAVAVTSPDADIAHLFPVLLPGGGKLLYTGGGKREPAGIRVADLARDGRLTGSRLLVQTISNAVFAPEAAGVGRILWVDDDDRTLRTRPFQVSDAAFTGGDAPLPRASQPAMVGVGGGFEFAASNGGSLLLSSQLIGQPNVRVLDRSGKEILSLPPAVTATFSPDGKKLAMGRSGEGAGVWIHDLTSGAESRLTFSVSRRAQNGAIWGADGKSLYYIDQGALRSKALTGGEEVEIGKSLSGRVTAVSPDGKFVLFNRASMSWDVWIWPLAPASQPAPYFDSPANEIVASFSPDGRWVAYDSDESGMKQIYVRPFVGERPSRAKWQISTGGGGGPRWAGNEIFYLALNGKLMSSRIRTEADSVKVEPAQVVLASESTPLGAVVQYPAFDVTADGRRFVFATPQSRMGIELRLVTGTREAR